MKLFCELDEDLGGYLIFLDIDGTLTINHCTEIPVEALDKLEELKQRNLVFLCSNGKNKDRNREFAEQCGVEYLDTPLKKPNKTIAELAANPEQLPLLVIGNLYLTDGRFAKNIGARFIKVKTLMGPEEPWLDRLAYFLDEHLISLFV